MKHLIVAFSLILFSGLTSADDNDHPMSKMIGEDIDLSVSGHTLAGKIGPYLVFGDVSTQPGHKTSELIVKTHDGLIKTTFGQSAEGTFGGILSNDHKSMSVEFVRIDKTVPAFYIKIDGEELRVRVEADKFEHNHFYNPTYILEFDGREYPVKLEEGKACWMYSMHLIFMVFGTFLY